MNIKKLLLNKSAQNAGWLIGGRIAQMVISLVVGIVSARYLGPSNYGLIGYAAAYTSFFSALCTLGINSVIVKELVHNRDNEGQVLGTAIFLKAISSFLSAICIVGIVCVIDHGETETIVVVALSSLGAIFNVLETFNYWFQSKLQSKVTAIAVFMGYLIMAAYKLFLVITGQSVIFFALATSLDYISVGIILIICYKKYGGAKLGFSWSYGKTLLKTSVHFILPSLMVAIYGQTDKLMLKQMLNEAEIGYYTTAVTICSMWCFVLQAIIDSLYPTIMESYKKGNIEAFNQKNRVLYALVFYISVFVSMLICICAYFIVLILYGEAYLNAVNPLRVVTWYTAFSYLGVARNAWVVCEDKQKYLIWVYSSAAVANVILNFIFIPVFKASGAALASLIAQVITTMVVPFFIKDLRPNAKLMLEAMLLKNILPKRKKSNSKK